jgi:hypothetical protein
MQPGWPDAFVKKIAQNVAQPIFRTSLRNNFYRGKKVAQKLGLLL